MGLFDPHDVKGLSGLVASDYLSGMEDLPEIVARMRKAPKGYSDRDRLLYELIQSMVPVGIRATNPVELPVIKPAGTNGRLTLDPKSHEFKQILEDWMNRRK